MESNHLRFRDWQAFGKWKVLRNGSAFHFSFFHFAHRRFFVNVAHLEFRSPVSCNREEFIYTVRLCTQAPMILE